MKILGLMSRQNEPIEKSEPLMKGEVVIKNDSPVLQCM